MMLEYFKYDFTSTVVYREHDLSNWSAFIFHASFTYPTLSYLRISCAMCVGTME